MDTTYSDSKSGNTQRTRALSQPTVTPQNILPFCSGNRRLTRQATRELLSQNEMKPEDENQENGDKGEGGTPPLPPAGTEPVNPDDITPAKWLEMFNTLNGTLASLSSETQDLKSLKTKVDQFSSEWKESVDNDLSGKDDIIGQQKFKINLMTNMIINQEERLDTMERRMTMAYQREIKPNLVIHGLIEKKDEQRDELEALIKNFFKTTMEIEQSIELNDWFRMGQGKTRSVLIKLKHPNDKAVIFKNAINLQGKENSQKKLHFIHEDLSDEQTETRQCYRDLQKENKAKDENDQLKIKMAKGKIVVNNETIRPRVVPTTKAEILRLTDKQLEQIKAIRLVNGPDHVEKGSEFACYAIKTKSEEEVRKAYAKLKIKHADATHISLGYRLNNPMGPFRQEAVEDKDYGIGRSILDVLKKKEITETAVFIVRYYGGIHLGKRRFEIVEQLVEKGIQTLMTKTTKRRARTQRQNSEESLRSVTSNLDSQDDNS